MINDDYSWNSEINSTFQKVSNNYIRAYHYMYITERLNVKFLRKIVIEI